MPHGAVGDDELLPAGGLDRICVGPIAVDRITKGPEIATIPAWSGSFGATYPRGDRMDEKQDRRSQPVPDEIERPIPPDIYPVIDNDLARDNVENDLPAADLHELR